MVSDWLSMCPSVFPSVRLSFIRPSVFLFLDDHLSKCQWIFTRCDILEVWFGIVNGQISSIYDSYLPVTSLYFHFWMITIVDVNGFSPNLVSALILWRSAFGLLMGKFHQCLTELSAHDMSVFSPNLVCALILWTSALGLLMGKFCLFLTELSTHDMIMVGYYHFMGVF